MDLANRLKNLFHSILQMIIQMLPAPPPPVDHEAVAEHQPPPAIPVDPEPEPEAPLLANYNQEKLDWAMRMIGFCLTPAVAIAIEFLEKQSHELPLAFHLLSLALILSFNFLFLSKFIAHKFRETAQLLERLGEIISTLDLVSGDKIKFLLIKAPLKDSYDLAGASFKVAEDFEVSIKLVKLSHFHIAPKY
ncbi:hypothetical protein LWI29_004575 [Acer saccharum]|uniref:Uncharacterized protein n=1 Tax=Acer saccharum TaxID=4024 RepID=A0AA39VCR6_ACESA|nr:hypothetical protein LWI29_004575 [Acer saccharum]